MPCEVDTPCNRSTGNRTVAASPNAAYPAIPYGQAHFEGIRREGCLYVDKTRFIRQLESERHVFLIRPRRFGKSLWLSVLESYYDRKQAQDFNAVFGGTDIGRQPTEHRNRYVVLRFDFSAFNDKLETLEARFEEYCLTKLRGAVERNGDLFPEMAMQRILSASDINARLNELFDYADEQDIPLYVLIDEYDNFANTILVHRGADAYHSFTHGGGFYRNFFATLKTGAAKGCLQRMFITGVSPVTMDDVTSGFNIGANISLNPAFNELLGFTEAEVESVLRMYSDLGALSQEVDAALDIMRRWYNGYRFAQDAPNDLYNTDMVLYYLKALVLYGAPPNELIDANVRIDYGKLRHLLVTGRQLNGNFDLLRHLIGEGRVDAGLVGSFPLERLGRRENFLSLMHYFGLLSIQSTSGDAPNLAIPNQTVRQLMYGYLRDAYDDTGVFSVDLYEFERLTRAMARDGDWHPFVERLSAAVAEQTSIRDFIQGEKVIQGFLAAYLCTSNCFVLHTEMELNKGYADIVLEPMIARHSSLRHGYVLEVKYLKRDAAGAAKPDAALREATEQLRGYLADARLAALHPEVQFTGVALVFRGWELVQAEAVSAPSP